MDESLWTVFLEIIMKISEIKDILAQEEVSEERLAEFMSDERKGVQKLVQAYMKRLEKDTKEHLRVEALYDTENRFYQKNMYAVAGVDEVGRGPLAGPVTVAAVILPPYWFCRGLNDSKKVTPQHREEIAEKIKKEAVAYSIVSLPPEEIDALNIYGATLTAMYRAIETLRVKAEAVIVDAMPLHLPVPVESMIHGDARSASVAAASIIAKVHRDHIMDQYDKEYPGYGFASNKGYGTAEHIEAIHRLGITPIHRKSFEPVKSMVMKLSVK